MNTPPPMRPNLSRSGHNQDTKNTLLAGRLIQIAKTSKHLTQDVLDALVQGLEGSLNAVAMHVGDPMQREAIWEHAAWKERRRIEQCFQHLTASGLLETSQHGTLLGVTEKGHIMALQNKIRSCKKEFPKQIYCLVAFDIPEEKEAIRKSLRRLLKQQGFSLHQRSLWISSKDVVADMIALFRLMNLNSEWITVYKAHLVF